MKDIRRPLEKGYDQVIRDVIKNNARNTTGPNRFIEKINERFSRINHSDILTIVHQHNLNNVEKYFSYNERLKRAMIDVCKRHYRFYKLKLTNETF